MDDYELNSKPISRGSSLFKQDPYTKLLNALRNKEPRTFRRLLETEDLDPNHFYDYGEYKTCLDIACSDPGLSEFVKILLDNDADINKVNETHKKAPIHFAVETGDVNTVQMLVEDPKINIDILSKGNTALHLAIKQIKEFGDDNDIYVEKYEKIVKMLLEKGTNVNIPDLKNITPIYSAANQHLEGIVKLIIEYSQEEIDLDSYKDRRGKTARKIIEETYPKLLENISQGSNKNGKVDIHKLFSDLSGHNEETFLKDLQKIKDKEQQSVILGENNGLYTLLQFACNNGMDLAAKALLEMGADPNATAPGNNMKPIALACCGGFYKILNLFVAHEATSFEPINGDSLLQLAIKEEKEDVNDPNVNFKECKRILIANEKNINFIDVKRNTALHYATKSGDQDTVLQLLKSGAYVGIRNKFNDPPLADISAKTFEAYLDGCLDTNKERPNDENYEIQFDYSFLVPPSCAISKEASKVPLMNDSNASSSNDNLMPETDVLLYMTRHPDLKNLLKHPVITSFLYLKWQRISYLFYANITFYSLFWLSLILYILLGYQDEKTETTENIIQLVRILTIIGVTVLAVREFLQIVVSPKRYLKSFENWLEIALIVVTIVILSDESASKRQQFCAVAILLSSAELVLLIGQFPSLSTNIVMLKTVSWNFFKFLLWYCILIIAFALSFYTLFRTVEKKDDSESKPFNPNKPSESDDEETNFFLDPGMSLFKTIVMLTGEFDAGSINFSSFPITSHIIFIIFVFMIPIVLFNLLNGLAVSDTQAIKSDAELVSQISRIQLISYFESVLLGDMQPYQNAISNMQNACCWLPGQACIKPRLICVRPLARRICLFPEYLPMAKIGVKVNQSSRVEITPSERMKKNQTDNEDIEAAQCCLNTCKELHMDRQIVKASKNIINAKQAEATDIQKMKLQLQNMERLIEQIYNTINAKN